MLEMLQRGTCVRVNMCTCWEVFLQWVMLDRSNCLCSLRGGLRIMMLFAILVLDTNIHREKGCSQVNVTIFKQEFV